MKKWELLSLIFLLIAGWFILSYKLTEIPPGINGDEASIGYNAILVEKTLHDENNRTLPLFIQTLEGKDWKQPVTFYSTVAAFKIFGPSFFVLRSVSIIFALISLIFLFFLIRGLTNIKLAFIGGVMFLTSPLIVIQSHFALENIAPLPFVIWWLWMLVRCQKCKKTLYVFLAGLSLALGFYSHYAMRLIAPTLVIVSAGFLLEQNIKDKNRLFKNLIIFSLGLLPGVILFVLAKLYYPGALLGSARPVTIHSVQQFLLPYLSSFDLSFLYLSGDAAPYYSTGLHGLFLLITLPLFLIGAYRAIREKNSVLLLALISFFTASILFGLVDSLHRASRLVALAPFYILITLFGVNYLLNLRKSALKTVVLITLSLLFILSAFDFLNYYWSNFAPDIKTYFPYRADVTFRELKSNSQTLNLKPVIENSVLERENIAGKFFEEVYFNGDLDDWSVNENIPSGSIVLIYTSSSGKIKQNYKLLPTQLPSYSLAIIQ